MDGRDFFPIADRYRVSNSEAERRTSIGRSYYALFNIVLGVLSGKGVIFTGIPEDHYKLISYLAKSGSKTASSVGSALKDLRLDRNAADYKLRVAINAQKSDFLYQKATIALAKFDSITPQELAAIVATIQALP